MPPLFFLTVNQTRLGATDPTCRIGTSSYSRALITPEGPGVLVVEFQGEQSTSAIVSARGPAEDWILAHHLDMLGLTDHQPVIDPVHPAVEDAGRRFGALRLAATRTPYQDLLMAVLGQRITAKDAATQWRRLVLALGEPAPGGLDLRLPPAPEQLAHLPYHRLHRFGIERRRADALKNVARRAHWLFGLSNVSDAPSSQLTASLQLIPGIGPWTAAVAGGTAFGDPDALRVGDFHVKNTVSWALAGLPRGTDDDMISLLQPYGGQRERVVRWLQAAGWRAPRFGPGRRNVDVARL